MAEKDFDEAAFLRLREETEAAYKEEDFIFCPALKEKIFLTSDGFHHLRYDNNRSERSKYEQKNKLLYLKRALGVIAVTTTIQEFRVGLIPVGKIRNGMRATKRVEFYAFTVILNLTAGTRIRVVIRRIGDGNFHFWSVMPFWVQEKMQAGMVTRIIGSRTIEDE